MSAPGIADKLARRIAWDELDAGCLHSLIERARGEDLEGVGLCRPPRFSSDLSTALLPDPDKPATARLVARQELVVCGLGLVPLVLGVYGGSCRFEPAAEDGAPCHRGDLLGSLHGPARVLLESERILLNFLQHLSGIASQTRRYVEALGESGIRLLDTRKTTPGFRLLEKYAVACGGGWNHRLGLYDRVMLKDNHLAAGRGFRGLDLAATVARARDRWPGVPVEIEVDSLGQVPAALESGAEVILLDNFQPGELARAAEQIGARAATEASGGITLDSLPAITGLGLDFVSTGAVVHQATWKDIALDWD
jgi:nicotinate-nucleotide pyrophosphorylase (carboxylating)